MNVTSIIILSFFILNIGVGLAGTKRVPKSSENMSAYEFEMLRINRTRKQLNSSWLTKRKSAIYAIGSIGVNSKDPKVKIAAMRALKGRIKSSHSVDRKISSGFVVAIAKSTQNARVHRQAIASLVFRLAKFGDRTYARNQITEVALWSGDATTKRNAILALGTITHANAQIKKITASLNALTRRSAKEIEEPTHNN